MFIQLLRRSYDYGSKAVYTLTVADAKTSTTGRVSLNISRKKACRLIDEHQLTQYDPDESNSPYREERWDNLPFAEDTPAETPPAD